MRALGGLDWRAARAERVRPRQAGRARGPRALLALVALAGCKLVDQTTFAGAPAAPDPAELARVAMPVGRPALLTIRYGNPVPDYTGALDAAIAAAERVRPGIAYDVVAAIPPERDPALEVERLAAAGRNAAEVMQRMMALGVPALRIRLGAVSDPAIAMREVRVYIR